MIRITRSMVMIDETLPVEQCLDIQHFEKLEKSKMSIGQAEKLLALMQRV